MPTTVHITDQGNQTISGVKTFATGIFAPNLVYNTGNQTISGIKTFATGVITSGNLQVSGTGIFNAIDLNNIDNLSLSGVDVTITSGVLSLTNSLSAPNIVYNTGNQTVSGVKNFATGIFAPNLIYNSGDQSITGTKIFVGSLGLGNITAPNSNKLYFYDTGTAAYNTIKTYSDELPSYTIFELSDQGSTSKISIDLVSKTISGADNSAINFSNRPTVNNTGVLLSGQNSFTVFMQATNSNPSNDNISYFNNIPGGPATVIDNKKFQIGEKCVARKASWNHYLDTFTGIPNQNATGYFINVTTQSTGVISTGINANTFGTSGFSYVSEITPNIAVNETDYVVCGLKWGNYTLGSRPSGWRVGVNIYCYN
jgi:hypothetical protein